MKKQKILVTGSNGFVGQNVVQSLEGRYSIQVLDRGQIDKNNLESYKQFVADADAVIHLASVNGSSQQSPSYEELKDGNYNFTESLLNAIQAYGKPSVRFVYTSSIHVYGKPQSVITESTETLPVNSYGHVKLNTENLIQEYAKKGVIQAIILRSTHIYGPLCQAYRNNFIATLIKKAINGETIQLFGGGQIGLDLVYIKDLVKVIEASIEKQFLDSSLTINVSSGRTVTLENIVRILGSLLSEEVLVERVPSDVTQFHIPTEKLKSTFGFIPNTTITKGLKETLLYFLEQGQSAPAVEKRSQSEKVA